MTEITIDIDDEDDLLCENIPSWAYNYLSKNEMLFTFKGLTKHKRFLAVQDWRKNEFFCNGTNLSQVLKVMRINEAGNLVFFWNTEAEMTMFLLQWG